MYRYVQVMKRDTFEKGGASGAQVKGDEDQCAGQGDNETGIKGGKVVE